MNKIHYPYQTVLKDAICIHESKLIWRNASLVAKAFCRLYADMSSILIHPTFLLIILSWEEITSCLHSQFLERDGFLPWSGPANSSEGSEVALGQWGRS